MKDRLGFIGAEEGAVTVDWVVLTAAVVGMATAVGVYMDESLVPLLRQKIEDALKNAEVITIDDGRAR